MHPLYEQLKALRYDLEATAAYPWDAVANWVAKISPLITASLPEHWAVFEKLAQRPKPHSYGRFSSVDTRWDRRSRTEQNRNKNAEIEARELEADRKDANASKDRLLAWLDGILLHQGASQSDAVVKALFTLFDRLPYIVRRILPKRYSGRAPLTIEDEYDLQYLVHLLLTGLYHDIRPEEVAPSVAGGATRMDFLLKRNRVVIELKFVHDRYTDRTLGDELILDAKRYQAHPDCGLLICFVYDPQQRLKNPEALEHDVSVHSGLLPVHVVVRPK